VWRRAGLARGQVERVDKERERGQVDREREQVDRERERYACMYARMHVCMYVCMYVCTYTHPTNHTQTFTWKELCRSMTDAGVLCCGVMEADQWKKTKAPLHAGEDCWGGCGGKQGPCVCVCVCLCVHMHNVCVCVYVCVCV